MATSNDIDPGDDELHEIMAAASYTDAAWRDLDDTRRAVELAHARNALAGLRRAGYQVGYDATTMTGPATPTRRR